MPPGGNFAGFVNLAVLHYDGAPNAHPKVGPSAKIPVSVSPLVESKLHVRAFVLVYYGALD